MRLFWERTKQVIEPSSAVALAIVLAHRERFAGQRVGIIAADADRILGTVSAYRFRMGEAFPTDDPVARWLVTVSIALNDLVFALRGADEAKEDHELSEFFRLACLRL